MSRIASGLLRTNCSLQPSYVAPPKPAAESRRSWMAVPIAPSRTRTRFPSVARSAATRSPRLIAPPALALGFAQANVRPRLSSEPACKQLLNRLNNYPMMGHLLAWTSCLIFARSSQAARWPTVRRAGPCSICLQSRRCTVAEAARLAQEAEFFDRWAKENTKHLEPVDAAVLARYRRPRGLYAKEFGIRALGDVAGKRILDVGCGEGEDAMILALLGAHVTGLDVSPAAVELSRQRAMVNRVSDRTSF